MIKKQLKLKIFLACLILLINTFITIGCSVHVESNGILIASAKGPTYSPQTMQREVKKDICSGLNIRMAEQNAVCTKNLAMIKYNAKYANFDPSAMIGTSVSTYKINYLTPNLNGTPIKVSGAVLLPNIDQQQIKGVVLFFHGIVANKKDVSSNFNNPNIIPMNLDLSAIFASQGYIVVIPDYIGLGDNYELMHPYIEEPEVNVKSGLYMLIATRTLLQQIGVVSKTKPLNLDVTGYSEGASYGLWSANMFQQVELEDFLKANELRLKKIAPISGAYDLSGSQLDFVLSNVKRGDKFDISNTMVAFTLKPIFVSYLLCSIGHYSFNDQFTQLMQDNFFSLVKENSINNNTYNVFTLINDTSKNQIDNSKITKILLGEALYTINPYTGIAYSLYSNSASSITSVSIKQNADFMNLLKRKTLIAWQTKVPILLISLVRDSLITPLNSLNAYIGIKNLSSPELINRFIINNEDFTIANQFDAGRLTELDHMQALPEASLAALSFFNG